MIRLAVLILLLVPLAAPAQAPAPADGTPLATPVNGKHTLNLKDADIRVLVATVSEITGRNFIIDPRVEGKVNVVSTQPMDADQVYAVFESVLRVHGYAAVTSGTMVKIVPEVIANQDGSTLEGEAGPDTIVTRVIPLRHVAAAELIPILRPLVPQQGNLAAHQGSNALIVSDRAGNLARIEALIRRIDTASDTAVEMIPLEHADAAEVARTLTLLTEDKTAALTGVQPRIFADARTNSILLSGDPSTRLRMRALVSHLDTPLESGESTQVIYVRYGKAEELVPVLEATAATLTEQGAGKDAPKTATIQAHAETNALVVTADPAVFRALASIVRQLDVRRAQILIEGVIVEVGDEFATEIGVQWQSTNLEADADGNITNSGFLGGTNFPGLIQPGIVGLAANPGAVGGGLNIGYVGGTITLPGSDTPILQIGALVTALKQDGGTNILSQPSIVTLDHQEAQIKVGQQVPFVTGQYTNTGGGSSQPENPFQTINREDVGLTLKVTPHVNEGDSVRLDISQQISSLAPNPAGAVDLVTNNREIDTSVMVSDGAMLVLGGLISDEVRETIRKVPALGDIPVLGNLFRYRREDRSKRNLMVFLKPSILRDEALESAISSDKYNFIRARQLEKRTKPGYVLPDNSQPLLPEIPWAAPLRLPEPGGGDR
ncbi:MAG: type II secretion system secretin GspD [Xanthomonadales bacterium]|nr:type II secretion system secretin GspD [Xanthomonadales bacterium]MBP7418964.1 type II secretion system secretin GspD [Xanthomonadales bacterium]